MSHFNVSKCFPFSHIITQSCNLLVSFLFCGVQYLFSLSKNIHLVISCACAVMCHQKRAAVRR